MGTQIPFAQLGYPTLIELLKSIPGLQKEGFNQEGDMVVSLDASQSGMSHIQDMVKRQQGHKAKQRSTAARYVVSRAAPVSHLNCLKLFFITPLNDNKNAFQIQRRSYFAPRFVSNFILPHHGILLY